MTLTNDSRRRLADLPLDERRARDAERTRELDEGLTRRHLHRAEFADAYAAVQFERILRNAPAIAAKMRGD